MNSICLFDFIEIKNELSLVPKIIDKNEWVFIIQIKNKVEKTHIL